MYDPVIFQEYWHLKSWVFFTLLGIKWKRNGVSIGHSPSSCYRCAGVPFSLKRAFCDYVRSRAKSGSAAVNGDYGAERTDAHPDTSASRWMNLETWKFQTKIWLKRVITFKNVLTKYLSFVSFKYPELTWHRTTSFHCTYVNVLERCSMFRARCCECVYKLPDKQTLGLT